MSNSIQGTIPAEQLVVMSNRIRVWSGTVKISRESDLAAIKDELPPKNLASDGRWTLIESKHLAGLESVRKSIERDLKDEGFSYVGCGIAVTTEKCQRFLAALPNYEQDFNTALDDVCRNLQKFYQEMLDKAGTWKQALIDSQLTPQQVKDRCQFGMAVFRMASPDMDPDSVASQQYRNTVSEAFPALLDSVAKDAYRLLDTYRGKSRMLQSQLENIRKLVTKLKAFAFLDPRVGPATAGMQAVLANMPVTGVLNEVNASMCVAVLEQLVRPETIIQHGVGVIADVTSQRQSSNQAGLPFADAQDFLPPAFTAPSVVQPAKAGLLMGM